MKEKLKQVTPVNWLLIAVIIIGGIVWFVTRNSNVDSNRVLIDHYKEIINQGAADKEATALERDSIANATKKKDIIISSLRVSLALSKGRVNVIYKDSDEKINYIASVGRDTTRHLFTGYIND